MCNLSIANKDVYAELRDQLEKYWLLEEVNESKSNKWSSEEQECENYFIQTTKRDHTGRFNVALPLRENADQLGESQQIAQTRFFNLEKPLNRNMELKTKYNEFMLEYLKLEHALISLIPINQINLYIFCLITGC